MPRVPGARRAPGARDSPRMPPTPSRIARALCGAACALALGGAAPSSAEYAFPITDAYLATVIGIVATGRILYHMSELAPPPYPRVPPVTVNAHAGGPKLGKLTPHERDHFRFGPEQNLRHWPQGTG